MEMAGFAAEIAAGVTAARLAEIEERKAVLNETIPSFKVSLSIFPFTHLLHKLLKGKGGFLLLSFD